MPDSNDPFHSLTSLKVKLAVPFFMKIIFLISCWWMSYFQKHALPLEMTTTSFSFSRRCLVWCCQICSNYRNMTRANCVISFLFSSVKLLFFILLSIYNRENLACFIKKVHASCRPTLIPYHVYIAIICQQFRPGSPEVWTAGNRMRVENWRVWLDCISS